MKQDTEKKKKKKNQQIFGHGDLIQLGYHDPKQQINELFACLHYPLSQNTHQATLNLPIKIKSLFLKIFTCIY